MSRPNKFPFFSDNVRRWVHRVGRRVYITNQDGSLVSSFEHGRENTPLRQAAQWKIEEHDPHEA